MLIEIVSLIREVFHPLEIILLCGLFVWALIGVVRMYVSENF
jgi:hypothetical protein